MGHEVLGEVGQTVCWYSILTGSLSNVGKTGKCGMVARPLMVGLVARFGIRTGANCIVSR